jgi:MFS family permease
LSVAAGVRPGRVLALCLAAHAFLAIDRGLMGVLQEAIKRDLLLSDSQLAMISGLSFGIFFALASLPIGWLVDRFNRRNILAISVLIFSGVTALGASASSFGQLFLMRSVVGVGEAGGIPAATSLLADLYPASRRASVFSIFYIGTPLGLVIAFFVGGWVATHFGWAHLDWYINRHNAGELTAAEGSAAKLWHTEMLGDICDMSLQLHGGAGYMNEYVIARLWHDARVTRIYGGTSETMREVISRTL